MLVLEAAGTGVGLLIVGGTQSDRASYLVFGFALAAVGTIIGGLIYNAKEVASAARLPRGDVLYPLESEERKQINRRIAGKSPIDREHLSVTRAGAAQQRKRPGQTTSSDAKQLVVVHFNSGELGRPGRFPCLGHADSSSPIDRRDSVSGPRLSANQPVSDIHIRRIILSRNNIYPQPKTATRLCGDKEARPVP